MRLRGALTSIAASIAGLALPGVATAQIASRSCLTPDQAEGLIMFALPDMIDAVGKRCKASLPATSALVQSGSIIASKYRPDAEKAWPLAGVAIDRLMGAKVSVMGPERGRALARGLADLALSEKLATSDCGKVDRFIDILQPLPARNIARLVVAGLEFSKPDPANKPPITLCKPVTK